MKLLVMLLALVAAVSPAPQGFNVDTQDAEIVPSDIPSGSSGSGSFPSGSFPSGSFPDGFDIHFINIPGRPRPSRPSLIDLIFGQGPSRDPSPTDSNFPDIFRNIFGGNSFPTIFRRPVIPSLPSLPEFPNFVDVPDLGDLPDGYNNSTHEVTIVNGSRVEMNQTVTKNEKDGVVFTQILISVSPDRDGPIEGNTPGSSASGDAPPKAPKEEETEPEGSQVEINTDPDTNQIETEPVEDFGKDPSTHLIRHRRWLLDWIRKTFPRYNLRSNSLKTSNDKTSSSEESSGDVAMATYPRGQPQSPPLPESAVESTTVISLANDIAVNYVGVRPRYNPDAEVFDVDLIREDEDRFIASRSEPIMSYPIRSQPIRSQPIRSQPIRSQPIRSQPISWQPMRPASFRSLPMISQPLRSHKKSSRLPKSALSEFAYEWE